MSYLNKKANNLTPTEVNSKIINYMTSNLDEIPNYSYNYVDEGKNAVVFVRRKIILKLKKNFIKGFSHLATLKK